ncbi:NAD-P-binding protein [Fomitopsis serialis]|uniref:NAD-P-binding protein n=1 Tax=Fomitopsis serialis TaxID=139415 RepID=UPI002007E882|nr:NAD-P-binding protein [Neoantrodia serialis]KAH9913715.1 NAD-P-binding protein [Neoantrodia serialis]
MAAKKLIAVCGATGNQGGSVAKLLLRNPEQYVVRALTRDPTSAPAQALATLGADVVRVDLTVPTDVNEALQGCWGVFGVTNFYDPKIKDDPESEERQGKNLVDAALAAGVRCFVWSTVPSSAILSGGRLVSQVYEGKYHVTQYIQETGLPATFLYTGNFYENMVYRSHMVYHRDKDQVEFLQPIVKETTELAMLYVEKDLSAITKAVFDHWGTEHAELNHKFLYCANARLTPLDICESVKRVTGKSCVYTVLPTTHVPDRDIMLHLYNEMGMYGAQEIPDEHVLKLGVRLHDIDDFVRSRLAPHLGLPVVG